MAARISASVVDFAVVAVKIPVQQKNSFLALKGKVEGHLRTVNSLPAALPAIDFAAYSKVPVPGMVENFQTKYAALTVPYPSDQGTIMAIDDQAVEQKAAAAAWCSASAARIAGITTELAKWEAMQPVEEMNREEALDAGLIGTTITGIYNPNQITMWPHTETWEAYLERLEGMEDDDDH